ncbi:hypothetical protein IE81DRAFT_131041 [Ceraceosorus guamensis]|uniref:Uncharacterized protein n=1 Tax=Ceraceosorus guamensis TaxID=1522189 RepID=A0A316W7Y8_9BASI|nr:hypothetical protein IE81DRAFT_131041 [Ceraceosorus guamensis]PWN45932.1 hypothetical protein IE81DRAFT_131041 [Ceraceosorus guamensis]
MRPKPRRWLERRMVNAHDLEQQSWLDPRGASRSPSCATKPERLTYMCQYVAMFPKPGHARRPRSSVDRSSGSKCSAYKLGIFCLALCTPAAHGAQLGPATHPLFPFLVLALLACLACSSHPSSSS